MSKPPKRKSKRPGKQAARAEAPAVRDQTAGPPSQPQLHAAVPPQPHPVSRAETIRASVAAPANALAPATPTPAGDAGSPRDSLELIRLRAALVQVNGLAQDKRAEFRRAAEEAPFLLRSLGLGAGLSTLAAKEGGRARFAGMLATWLLRGCLHSPLHQTGDAVTAADALTAIAGSNRETYRAAQIEAQGYASTLKRLAQALCPKEDG